MSKLTIQTKSIPTYRQIPTGAVAIANAHYQRVIADGGTIDDSGALLEAVMDLEVTYGSASLSTFLAACIKPSIFGYKYRTDGTGTWCVKAYSLMGAASDVEQATPASQPRLLRYSGEKFFFNPPNENGNRISTPSTAANDIVGDIDIDADINFTAGGTVYLCDRRNATQQFTFSVAGATNFPSFSFYNGAINETVASTVAVASGRFFVRVKRIALTGVVTFYTSTDGTTWTQLGATVASTAGNLTTQVADIRLGSTGSGVGTGNLRCFSMRLYNGDRAAGGTLVTNFLASDYDISVSQNTLTSSTSGEVWTIIRSSPTSGYKAQLIYQTTIQGDGVDDELNNATFAQAQPNTAYMMVDEMTWVAARVIIDGGSTTPLYQRTATPNMSASAGTDIDYASEVLNRLKLYMAQFDGASSIVGTNGTYTAPAAGGAADYDALNILSSGGADFASAIFDTCVIPKQADDLTTLNAMNVLVRSWSGNPAV